MQIIQLEAENVKRLNAVNIKPDGNIVVIGGRNAQGKSSVLDSIFMALAGKKAQGSKPVKDGMDKAKIVVDLGDMVVTRTITKDGGGTIKVANKEGAVFQSPQAILDGLCSRLSFDPLAFLRERPAAQRDMLQGLVGLDFTEMDERRAFVFEKRTGVNRDLKALRAQVEGMPVHPDAPAQEVSVSALVEELERARVHNGEVDGAKEDIEDNIEAFNGLLDDMNAEGIYSTIYASVEKHVHSVTKLLGNIELPGKINVEEIQVRLSNAEETNRKVRENAERLKKNEEVKVLEAGSRSYTEEIEKIDSDKAKAMAKAKFPVDGLAFGEDGITMNGIPFDQCSSAEQLRVSVAMGIAMNPKLRVLLIRDGSLLDEDSLGMVAAMAAEHDAQVWIERVGKGKECSVVIEDGAVENTKEENDG